MTYKINDVGDACCIQIGRVFHNELLLDFGFPNDDKFNRFLGQLCNFEESLGTRLLVSHYHTDHFNGLIKFAKCGKKIKPDINEIYLPFIPQFDDSSEKISKEFILYNNRDKR
jgi:metal-dependent hydrolase (beta-lactamase superfamily II)